MCGAVRLLHGFTVRVTRNERPAPLSACWMPLLPGASRGARPSSIAASRRALALETADRSVARPRGVRQFGCVTLTVDVSVECHARPHAPRRAPRRPVRAWRGIQTTGRHVHKHVAARTALLTDPADASFAARGVLGPGRPNPNRLSNLRVDVEVGTDGNTAALTSMQTHSDTCGTETESRVSSATQRDKSKRLADHAPRA